MTGLTQYFKDTIAEMKQVHWPNQKTAFAYTLIVIAVAAFVSLFLGAFDFLFGLGIDFIISKQ